MSYYGYDLTKEEDVKTYLKNIGTEYRYRCYKENDPEVCHLLGMYFDIINNDKEKAKKLYKVNCDNHKWGMSCFKYAAFLYAEKKPENVDELIRYANLGCEEDVAKSCYVASIAMGDKAEKNPDLPDRESVFRKSLELMDKACTGRVGRACFNLTSIYYMGLPEINVRQDPKKVLEYSIKGCESLHLQSCVNATLMYSKGDGVEKNEKLAKQYEMKARDLQEQMTASGIKYEETL